MYNETGGCHDYTNSKVKWPSPPNSPYWKGSSSLPCGTLMNQVGPQVAWPPADFSATPRTCGADTLDDRKALKLYREFEIAGDMDSNTSTLDTCDIKMQPESPDSWFPQTRAETTEESFTMEDAYGVTENPSLTHYFPIGSRVSLHSSRAEPSPAQAGAEGYWAPSVEPSTFFRAETDSFHASNIPWQPGPGLAMLNAYQLQEEPHGLPILPNNSFDISSEMDIDSGGTANVGPSSSLAFESYSSVNSGASAMDVPMMVDTSSNLGQSSLWQTTTNSGSYYNPPTAQWSTTGHPIEPTVSPKALRINPSPTPASSTESVHATFFTSGSDGEYSFKNKERIPTAKIASSRRGVQRGPLGRPRKQLPDKSPHKRFLPILPSNGPPLHGGPSSKNHSVYKSNKGKARDGSKLKHAAAAFSSSFSFPFTSSSRKKQGAVTVPPAPRSHGSGSLAQFHQTMSSSPNSTTSDDSTNDDNNSPGKTAAGSDTRCAAAAKADAERALKNDFLLKSKLAGMTYKEIRRKGNFTEAESTLRGRFRTLTKSKEERVRKPEWTETDLYLLDSAVEKLAKGDNLATAKVPWKLVAEHILTNGGSYLFGNSTCRKKWDERHDIVRGSEDQD